MPPARPVCLQLARYLAQVNGFPSAIGVTIFAEEGLAVIWMTWGRVEYLPLAQLEDWIRLHQEKERVQEGPAQGELF